MRPAPHGLQGAQILKEGETGEKGGAGEKWVFLATLAFNH